MESLAYLALIPAMTVLAIVAHELTHYITIWPVAEEVAIRRKSRWRLETVYQIYNDPWRMKYADISNLSPSILGLGFLIYTFFNPVPISLENLWLVPAWLAYTIGGSADYARLLP
jgi:uncharacterized membrane protein